MKPLAQRLVVLGLLLGACNLAGCSKSEPTAPAAPTDESPATTQEAKVEKPAALGAPSGDPLKIAYSDWPGWVAWDIGIQKGWFADAGVAVDFSWFEYTPSMDAFSAGKVDAVAVTNGDALVTGSSGAPGVGILLNDFSNGNDMVVGRPGLTDIGDLKGKKVGVEVGFVSHLLLMKALEKSGLTEKDITIVNMPTDQTPQALSSGQVDAIVAWQPNSGQALKEVPDSEKLFTSADEPGLIYDMLVVSPRSLKQRREDWKKVVSVWFRIADFLKDPDNKAEALKIMSARVGLKPAEYDRLMGGTHFLDLAGNLERFARGEKLTSVYRSSKVVDDFKVKNGVYKKPMPVDEYLDPSIVQELSSLSMK